MAIFSRSQKTRVAVGLVSVGAALSLSSCGLLLPGRPGEAPPPPPSEDRPRSEETTEEQAPAGDGGEFRTGPIPSASMSFDEELPDVNSDDDPVLQVEGELVNTVQEFAMLTDSSTSATCDNFDASQSTTIDCTATFKGIDIPFDVEIEGGEYIFRYTPTPTEGMVASRDVVEDQMRYTSDNESVRCTMDEFQLVPVDNAVPGLDCFAEGDPNEYEVEFSIYGSIYISPVY